MEQPITIPKYLKDLINQIFEIEKKASKIDGHSIHRNINKIKDIFENELSEAHRITYSNPLGEAYNETRTDCDASIAGESTEDLIITEVIKPIIQISKDGVSFIAQKGVVIVESKKN